MILLEIYVVQKGDTLYQIARRYSVSADDIIFANQLENPELLSVGQALVIPTTERRYTVNRGDTLYSIAKRYDISLQSLLAANPNINNANRIFTGQTITIPISNQNLGQIVVNGYITDTTRDTLEETLPYLTFMSPFSYRSDRQGELIPTFTVDTRLSAQYRTANLLTVTNLKEHISDEMLAAADTATQIEAMKNMLVLAAEKVYGAEAMLMEVTSAPQELVAKYSSEEWRLGTRIPFEKDIIHRFEWGEVEVQLSMRGEYIKDVKIYSDALETEVFRAAEDLLRGCKFDATEIMSLKIPPGNSASGYEILKLIAMSI